MTRVEDLREQFRQVATSDKKEMRFSSVQTKEDLFARGRVQELVMDERTPIKTLEASYRGSKWVFYVIPPIGYDENHKDYDLVSKYVTSGEQGGLTFIFVNGYSEPVSPIILDFWEERSLQKLIGDAREKRKTSVRKLEKLFDRVHPAYRV